MTFVKTKTGTDSNTEHHVCYKEIIVYFNPIYYKQHDSDMYNTCNVKVKKSLFFNIVIKAS